MSKDIPTKYVINLSELVAEDYTIVGEDVYNDYYLLKNGIGTPQGLVVTKLAFDDFLLENEIISLFSKLLENRDLSQEHLFQISEMIRKTIEISQLNIEVEDQITLLCNKLFEKEEDIILTLKPSFLVEKFNIEPDYFKSITIQLNNIEELFKAVKQVYLSFYTPELVKARLNGSFQISCFAVLIRQVKTYEVSGKAVITKSKFNNMDSYELYAQYGDIFTKSESNENILTDTYAIDTATFRILHRKIIDQEYMYVRKGNNEVKIEVADEWKGKQKLVDHKILEVVEAVKKLDLIYKRPIEVYWGYEKGKLYIVSVVYLKNENTPDNFDDKEIVELPNKLKEVEIILIQESTSKLKDQYITIGNSTLLSRLRGGFNIGNPILLSGSEIFFEQELFNLTDSNIIRNSNSNRYLNGDTIVTKFEESKINSMNVDTQIQLMNELTIELANLAYLFYPKTLMYQFSSNKLNSIELDTRKMLIEAISIRNVVEDYDFNNLSVCLSNIQTFNILEIYLQILSQIRINSNKTLKIYAELDNISLFLNLEELNSKNLKFNGFVVDINKTMQALFNCNKFSKNQQNTFIKIFKQKLTFLSSIQLNLIFKINATDPDFIDNLLSLSPYGLILPFNK